MHRLQHWQSRLTAELARLLTDIETTEATADRWNGKFVSEALYELRGLHDKKSADLQAVNAAISEISQSAEIAAAVAVQPGATPLVVIPRQKGHPATGALLQSAATPALYSKAKIVARSNTREMSRNVARQSAILANSPDPISKRLIFS